MKKLVLSLTAAAILTGCSSAKPTEQEKNVTELAAVVTTTDSATTVETTTAVKTTTTAKTTTKSTSAKTTTAKKTSETSASAKNDNTATPQENVAPAPAPAEKHYTTFGDEINEAEWSAIGKVKAKYGIDCEVVARNLCWESWPKVILNDDGTRSTIPVEPRDPNEPLNVVYVLKGSDGIYFDARIKEKTDIITHDNYLYTHYWEQLKNEAAGSLQKLVPGGKVYLEAGASFGELPFECPAEMTYEEFRQALADNKGYLFGWLFAAEGMDVSDDMRAYSPRRGNGHPGEYGYLMQIHVEQVSQEDYDRLDDIMTEYPKGINAKTVN